MMSGKNSFTRQVRRAYNQDTLARILTLPERKFGRAFGMQTVRVEQRSSWRSSDRPEDYYHFRDNGSSVLAVAHLDTVVRRDRRTPRFSATERGPLVVSGALDDRLGAYVILKLLPELGVTCDWLLTVGEESGQSTAEHFKPGKDYDWVIEFDRGGTDVVMYQYEDRASRRAVEASGAVMGHGSYSDIAYLEHLGVKAFNWGVGYQGDYHSERGYAYLGNTFAMTAKYLRFHEQNAGTAMPHEPERYSGYSRYDDYYGDCDVCFAEESVDSVTGYCLECGACQDCGQIENKGCMCYVPDHIRGEASRILAITPATSSQAWRQMTWGEYCTLRPGKSLYDDVLCANCSRHVAGCECAYDNDPDSQPVKLPWDAGCTDCGKDLDACTCALDAAAREDAYQEAMAKDGPGPLIPARRSPSIAPPWSGHRTEVPTSRTKPRKSRNHEPAGAVSRTQQIIAEWREENTRSAASPPAVFPDADLGWHAGTRTSADGLYVSGHQPSQAWARICLRCAARWPHPVSSTDIHPESDCPGCERCVPGAIHAIAAHLAGESDLCGLCRELNTRPDTTGASLREIAAGLVSQKAADRYLAGITSHALDEHESASS